MEHSWIPPGLYDEHCVHRLPCVASRWADVHLNTTDQSRSTSPLVPHLWIAGCRLADGDVTDDRDTWCWICVNSTQKLSGWLWHSLITQCTSILQAVKQETFETLLLAHLLRRWANISPVLGYCVVFDATLNVGQHHRRRANINPAVVQSIVTVPPACMHSQHKVLIRTECLLAITGDAGPTFNKYWVSVGL